MDFYTVPAQIMNVLALVLTLLHYGFFDSIQAANENAINHSKEGISIYASADKSLYRSKNSGKNTYSFYSALTE